MTNLPAEYPSHAARTIYARLLRLYPKWFRELYAHQMMDDFVELFRTTGASGSIARRIRCWLVALRDLAISVPRERLASFKHPRPDRRPPTDPPPRGEAMASVLQDVRYAVRMLRQHPGFSAMVIVTLALGIGANIAMFSVIDSVLLSSLPYRDADRLVMVWNRHAHTPGANRVQVSGLDFRDYRERAASFEEFAFIHNAADLTLTGEGPAEQIDVGYVSANFFQFLGSEPRLGRTFLADDGNAATPGMGGQRPVIISHGLWQRRYGSDPDLVGGTIQIANVQMEVVGVMPSDFELIMPEEDGGATGGGAADPVDVWGILREDVFDRMPRSFAMFRVLGRVNEGVTLAQAQEEMNVVAGRLRDEHRMHLERGMMIDLVPMRADVVGKTRLVVLSLFGAVGFVLLIACANVANLILVRAAHRQREVAVRAALGASAGRLVRQLLTENALLAIAGTALGLLFASMTIDAIVAAAPSNVPFLDEVGIDARVVAFAVAMGGVAILLFGLMPALRSARTDVQTHLHETPRGSAGGTQRLRAGIVISEIALSLVLLVGSGLMIRSFVALQGAQLGFEPASALTAKITMPHGQYDDPVQQATYWNGLRREAARVPGVEAAALVWPLPFAGRGLEVPYGNTGGESMDWGRFVAALSAVSPGYFETMDAQLIDGRTFEEADLVRDNDVAIVDDVVAYRLFPDANAVGRVVWIQSGNGRDKVPLEIVGVVGHMRHESVMGFERESIYRPTQTGQQMALVVRTAGDPLSTLGGIQNVASELDPGIPVFDARTFTDYIGDQIAPTRFTMALANTFATMALVLAAVGLYGVISYSVAQRASEIGVRIALGAHGGAILRLVLRHGLALATGGIVLGLGAAIALTRAFETLLFGVAPTDPTTLVGVSLLLGTVALLASYFPARRAARLDPLVALRGE